MPTPTIERGSITASTIKPCARCKRPGAAVPVSIVVGARYHHFDLCVACGHRTVEFIESYRAEAAS